MTPMRGHVKMGRCRQAAYHLSPTCLRLAQYNWSDQSEARFKKSTLCTRHVQTRPRIDDSKKAGRNLMSLVCPYLTDAKGIEAWSNAGGPALTKTRLAWPGRSRVQRE